MVGAMGCVGVAGDNATTESSFSLLQKNVLDRQVWSTREDLRITIVTWIEWTTTTADDEPLSADRPQSNLKPS